jgi:hypothetical protein
MSEKRRIIVIGDLHGDYLAFIEILKFNRLINDSMEWIGGKTIVVQVGDTLDAKRPGIILDSVFLNTPEELILFESIISLNTKAKKHGGEVISLLGNHELYPYYLRNDQDMANEYIKLVDREEYLKVFKIKRKNYFYPGNPGAKLMGITRPLMLQIGEFLFIHGSLTDKFIKTVSKNGKIDINAVNRETSLFLQGKLPVPEYLKYMNEDNILFNRDFSSKKSLSQRECSKLIGYLRHFDGVKYIVMGHTSYKHINSTCYNRIIRTDLALSRAFGGNIESNKDKYQTLEIIQKRGVDPVINVISKNGKIPLH